MHLIQFHIANSTPPTPPHPLIPRLNHLQYEAAQRKHHIALIGALEVGGMKHQSCHVVEHDIGLVHLEHMRNIAGTHESWVHVVACRELIR